jgi:hypothetical protein
MEGKRPLKRFLSGMEFEFFIIDDKGKVVPAADKLISKVTAVKADLPVTKECGRNMIEINGYPKERPEETVREIMETYKVLLDVAHREGLFMCPLGCYPGSFKPEMRKENKYKVQEKIFGKKFAIAGTVCGLHYHYTMPKGIFDKKALRLRKLVHSELKQSLMNSYNLLIALDPVLSVLMASSPFYMGRHYGKDSRIFWYRGGRKLHFMDGLYSRHLSIGGLPPYKQTLSDLSFSINRRRLIWKKELEKAGVKGGIRFYKSELDLSWNPIRLNKHDTLEQRGMDMNYLDAIMGISTLLNFTLGRVQKEMLIVVPSDIGSEEPFKVEDNVMYIPPHTHVRNILQYHAAKDGFDNEEARKYCQRFLRLAKSFLPRDYRKIANPIFEIYNERQSLSDRILGFAAKKGFRKNQKLSQGLAEEIAINAAIESENRLLETEKLLNRLL